MSKTTKGYILHTQIITMTARMLRGLHFTLYTVCVVAAALRTLLANF